jgi:hypothetical protein
MVLNVRCNRHYCGVFRVIVLYKLRRVVPSATISTNEAPYTSNDAQTNSIMTDTPNQSKQGNVIFNNIVNESEEAVKKEKNQGEILKCQSREGQFKL